MLNKIYKILLASNLINIIVLCYKGKRHVKTYARLLSTSGTVWANQKNNNTLIESNSFTIFKPILYNYYHFEHCRVIFNFNGGII